MCNWFGHRNAMAWMSVLTLGLLLSATATSRAGHFQTDFSNVPPNVHFYGSTDHDPSHGVLRLTQPWFNLNGSMVIDDLDPGKAARSFQMTYGSLSDGGPTANDLSGQNSGALGMAISFGTNIPNAVFPQGENGAGDGLIVRFDTFAEAGDTFNNGIEVLYKNVVVAQNATGAAFIRQNHFVPVILSVDAAGKLNLNYNGTAVFTNLQLPNYTPMVGARFAFSARTNAQAGDDHCIDYITIDTQVPEPATATLLALPATLLMLNRRRRMN